MEGLSMSCCVLCPEQSNSAVPHNKEQGNNTVCTVCWLQVEVKLRLPGADAHSKLEQLLAPGRVATHQQVMQQCSFPIVN